MLVSELKKVLVGCVSNNLPIMIKGAGGVGKSDLIGWTAKETKRHLLTFHPAVDDPTNYKGLPAIVSGKAEFLPYGNLRILLEATEDTIAFFDDIGQAPACVQAALMQLFLNRAINGFKISDKVTFVACTNRKEDRAGVSGILETVKSRFATIIQLDPDIDSWVSWAFENDIPSALIGFLHFRPTLLHTNEATADIVNHPCPRTWHFVAKLMKAGLTNLEVFSGAVGAGAAAEFIGFLKIYQSLPDINSIFKNPKTAQMPRETSALNAVAVALVEKTTLENIENVFEYGKRMPKEFSMLLVRDLIRKNPKFQNTPSFIEWVNENQDFLM